MPDTYEYTHITWRARNADGEISTYVHTIHDRERAADEIKELALSENVFALRVIHYPQPDAQSVMSSPLTTVIGPPATA